MENQEREDKKMSIGRTAGEKGSNKITFIPYTFGNRYQIGLGIDF